MTQLSRPRYARKISDIANPLIRLLDGFEPHESVITKKMMAVVEDFPHLARREGYNVISLGGGIWKDYDQEKFWEGVYIKKYMYEYLVPYESEKTGDPRHFRCFMHFTKEWYREEWMGKPEWLGYLDCDTSQHGDEELAWDLDRRGLVVEKMDGEWQVTDVNEVIERQSLNSPSIDQL